MERLMIITDGMADELLEGRTPLSEATTPAFDSLARMGYTGVIDTALQLPSGELVAPESQQAIGKLLGYGDIGGRGVFEAIGAGMKIQPGMVYVRCNFLGSDGRLIRQITPNDNASVCEALSSIDGLTVEPMAAGRNIAAMNEDVSPDYLTAITTDLLPLYGVEEVEFVSESKKISLKPLTEIHSDIRQGLCVCATAMLRGLASEMGMDTVTPAGATGRVDTDLKSKLESALLHFEAGYDFVMIHVEAADEASHLINPELKRTVIERIDRELIAPALQWLGEDGDNRRLFVTSDHRTDSSTGRHTTSFVPAVIAGGGIRPDDVMKFSEMDVASEMLDASLFWE